VKPDRLLARILADNVTNIAFSDLTGLLTALGFTEIGGKGSHRIFARPGVIELVNLQGGRPAGQAIPGSPDRCARPPVRS